jgi:hypothetical protein
MSETSPRNAESSPRFVHVEAQADHLLSLARAKPVNALAELIWNALDADADIVRITVLDNELGTPIEIQVSDNGSGIDIEDAERAFGNLGGSWKKERKLVADSKKKLHGRDGKGRFKAFSLGNEVSWETTFRRESGTLQSYRIHGALSRLQDFDISSPVPAPTGKGRGTSVRIDHIPEPLGVLANDGMGSRHLAEHFALYLRNYPATRIIFRGQEIRAGAVQKCIHSVSLPSFYAVDGTKVIANLDIVEWTFAKKERRICLCDSEGYTLHDVEAGIRPGSEFNFTAYIRSEMISSLQEANALELAELDGDLRRILDSARSELRAYFRRRKAESVSELVTQWKTEGVYPFAGDAIDAVEKARREVFDICALNVHEYLDSFREGVTKDREFTLRMLKTALDENPAALKRILTDVLDLPKEKQGELADLLQFTSLSAIIEASRMVAERLQFLAGLEELVFHPSGKKTLRERTQLHRMLESETWIFGEEFLLSSSDENLTTVLRKNLARLRPGERRKKLEPVRTDDGAQAVIDLLLGRQIPAYARTRQEYLVVELKRPDQKVDLEVKAQIERYALAVASDERFDSRNSYWTFIAVSNEMTDEAAQTLKQTGKAVGFFHDTPNLKIGLTTWSEIIRASRTRLAAFKECLDYNATRDDGVALLHAKYEKYLPRQFSEELRAG